MLAGGIIAGAAVAARQHATQRRRMVRQRIERRLARAGAVLNRVLEIGTGCGYQAAVLSRIARQVYSVERISPLLMRARLKPGACC